MINKASGKSATGFFMSICINNLKDLSIKKIVCICNGDKINYPIIYR